MVVNARTGRRRSMSSSKKKFLAELQYSADRPPPPLSAWPAESRRVGDTGRGSSRNPFDLSDRIALVTGAARGIGRAVAERLASQGAHVIVTDINDEGSNETVAIIKEAGGSAEMMHFDVTDQEQIDRVCAATIAGHGRIDILINNAGICLNAKALETSKDIWDRQMRVNLDAVFYCSRSFGAHMVAQGSGAIVNLSSMAAIIDVHPQDHVGTASPRPALPISRRCLARSGRTPASASTRSVPGSSRPRCRSQPASKCWTSGRRRFP